MFVTLEVFQLDMFPLKLIALLKTSSISIMFSVFQLLKLLVNEDAPLNILDNEFTDIRNGLSVALTFKLLQPWNASSIEDQSILPHSSTDRIFSRSLFTSLLK